MKLSNSAPRQRRGFTLIEILCYLAVIGLVTSMAMATLFQLIEQTAALRRNCEEIAAAVQAGEIWRADIRQAKPTDLSLSNRNAETTTNSLVLRTAESTIIYRVKDGAVWRKSGSDATEEAILSGVKSSRFAVAPRKTVTAWIWEIELKTSGKHGATQPLFSFTAVPAGQGPR